MEEKDRKPGDEALVTDDDLEKMGTSPWCEGIYEGMHPCVWYSEAVGDIPAECRKKTHSPVPTKKTWLAGGGWGYLWPRCSVRPARAVNATEYHLRRSPSEESPAPDPAGMQR